MTMITAPSPAPAPHRTAPTRRTADQYDHDYAYEPYWVGRDYEDGAERIALRRILRHRRFGTAVDVGGGFGRLTALVAVHADRTTMIEPSRSQLEIAARVLRGTGVDVQRGQADDLPFPSGSVDLVTMVRVMHHLPDPTRELAEIARVLAPGGTAIIEVANYGHALNRWHHRRAGQPLPTVPVSLRSHDHEDPDAIPFVNHNLQTVVDQLAAVSLEVRSSLSVSNLRSDRLKRRIPLRLLLALEWCSQRLLAPARFGPSIVLEVGHRGAGRAELS